MSSNKYLKKALPLIFLISPALFGETIKEKDFSVSFHQIDIINSGIKEFKKTGINSAGYNIFLYPLGSGYVVTFVHESTSSSQRGSPRRNPSFEVELDKYGSVKNSHFSR